MNRKFLIMGLLVMMGLVGLVAFMILQKSAAHSTPDQARRKLAEKGIEFSSIGFVKSVRDGNVEAVDLFLDAGISPESKDESGSTVLMNAAIKKDSAMTQLLIDHGADVNARTKEGETSLMIAALMGDADTAKVLLKAGADLNARDSRGESPLAHARSHYHGEVVALLESAGAEE